MVNSSSEKQRILEASLRLTLLILQLDMLQEENENILEKVYLFYISRQSLNFFLWH